MMTDRPILFSAEMVRAILDGRKTQTRRVVKAQPPPDAWVTVEHYHPIVIDRHGDMQPGEEIFGAHWNDGECGLRCPYGAPGDQLWVREGFAIQPLLWADNRGPQPIHYTADQVIGFAGKPDQREIEDYRSKPSIHMPRWASRITLRITDIRVERLQDISEDDARAEGAKAGDWPERPECDCNEDDCAACSHYPALHKPAFRHIWNKINGPGAWDENPWVWVVAFERVKP
jgi:hypothetical protein